MPTPEDLAKQKLEEDAQKNEYPKIVHDEGGVLITEDEDGILTNEETGEQTSGECC